MGIHGASIRDITLTAGVRNKSAVQYHFGDRDGLIDALLARRGAVLRVRRALAWEQLVIEQVEFELRSLCRALIEPFCQFLDDGPGEWAYLVVANDLLSDPARDFAVVREQFDDPLLPTVIARLIAAIPLPEPLARERVMVGVTSAIAAVAARARRQLDATTAPSLVSVDVFVANLVDMLEASLAAPAHHTTVHAAANDHRCATGTTGTESPQNLASPGAVRSDALTTGD